jgi:ribosomal protein S18 acetylase RimI-like enzyme
MNQPLLRPATPADLPAILSVVRAVVPLMQAGGNFQWTAEYPNEAVFGEDIANGDLWVAEVSGQLGAVAAITTDQPATYAEAGLDVAETAVVVHRLAVHPDHRGLGLAEKLLWQAETVARARHIGALRIDTNTENQATQALFPKVGYRLAGEISLPGRDPLRFLCYEKIIVQPR